MASSDAEKTMIKADKLTKLSLTRWSADWKSVTILYEKASLAFRLGKDNEKAKMAFEKASKGQEMLSSPWDAAKHMESAASLAKELGSWNEVADLYRRASELYIECGRSQPASDALGKGAPALEDTIPDEAVRMYTDACVILEEDGKDQMAFDLYRAATSVYLKLDWLTNVHTYMLTVSLPFEIPDKFQNTVVPCSCILLLLSLFWYLSAIIVYLYAHDFKQAQKCHNDCSQIEAFLSSDQNHCASKLLSAYAEGDIEEIKRVAQSSTISNLDHMIIRLARKLPTGDLDSLDLDAGKDEEPFDENDLT
ncbi:gamma-soluble NSF attachment protein-like [Tasmannia lanceolata]|uniref:gamma-soluble NSF attachment protein-like n=1 Tax=Tasmannia lanceolata TaxID=3420 RepID=UPI00406490A9